MLRTQADVLWIFQEDTDAGEELKMVVGTHLSCTQNIAKRPRDQKTVHVRGHYVHV